VQFAAAVWLYVPFGHSHLMRSLHALSRALTLQWLSSHDTHAAGAPLDSKHELSALPLLLLEHANAVSAAPIAPTINTAFIIAIDLPWKTPPH
jgi:hypothetical protein